MKKTRFLTTLLIVLLAGAGWAAGLLGFFGSSAMEDNLHYNESVAEARDYKGRGLYQLAVLSYKEALDLKENETVRNEMLESYRERYKEDPKIIDEYIDALKARADRYPREKQYYTELVSVLIEDNEYYYADKYLSRAIEKGINDEEIQALFYQVKYGFQELYSEYTGFRPVSGNIYAVVNEDRWAYITSTGSAANGKDLVKAYSTGDEGISVRVDAGGSYMIDANEIIRGKLDFDPDQALLYSEGLVAVSRDGKYGYYDSLGDYQFGKYEDAGNFTNGIAPVNVGTGWTFIDTEGKETGSGDLYKDIKMDRNGVWMKNDHFIADRGQGYQLFDKAQNPVGTEKWDDTDVLSEDGIFAFKSGNLWGYADLEGNVMAEPQFEEARSFSNKLAAVRKGDQWGFIDTDFNMVISPQFSDADYFNGDGCCFVRSEDADWHIIKLRLTD